MRFKRLNLDKWMKIKNVKEEEELEDFIHLNYIYKEGIYKYQDHCWFEVCNNGKWEFFIFDPKQFDFMLDCLNARELRKEDIKAIKSIVKSKKYSTKKYRYISSIIDHNKMIDESKKHMRLIRRRFKNEII